MYDKGLVKEVLNQILKSAKTILKRFEPIKSSNDFLVSESGLEKLDAICMQLIAIGESLKNLDKITNKTLLENYYRHEFERGVETARKLYLEKDSTFRGFRQT